MKIISYNVNGIRAAMKKGFIDWLIFEQPDVICVQEIKALQEQIDIEALEKIGYKYNYWYSAQKKGYSGVGIISKQKPNGVLYGTGIPEMDFEGRNLRIDFDQFSVMSLYLPSGTNLDRLEFKLSYMDKFYDYVFNLKKTNPNLIIAGDFNICHKAIDIHDPIRNKNISGFLPVERNWLGKFIELGFLDSFRIFDKSPNKYSWWTYRANARANNKGWRIDYIMVSKSLENKMKNASILSEVFHSDHCPILIEMQ
ncbi:MAG: exodeoxyribonuclease III [Flavobacteriaceae bacterium]|tara:strand:+ start:4050 stop:4811 length:762 start_codon:yes stop_codon:yes gene_type:complete